MLGQALTDHTGSQQTGQLNQTKLLELGQTYAVKVSAQAQRLAQEQATQMRHSIEEMETYSKAKSVMLLDLRQNKRQTT